MKDLVMKFYSPLTADFYRDGHDPVVLDSYELLDYSETISDALARENASLGGGDLMPYYHAKDGVSEKVVSAVVSADWFGAALCCCATVHLRAPLTGEECFALQEYLCGQYSDGLGEGFEQREIRVDGGALYVHLWQPDGFAFETMITSEPQKMSRTAQKKYEITGIAHPQHPVLHRIRALCNVTQGVKAGDLGGYVQSEDNLSQEGACWIYDDAVAWDQACVAQDAALRENAMACDEAFVGGHADVAGAAVIQDEAIVLSGHIFENACICGEGKVLAGKYRDLEPRIFGRARIYGTISGNVICSSDTEIPWETELENPSGDVRIYGTVPGYVLCRSDAVILPGVELINPTRDQFLLNGKEICVQPREETRAIHKPKRAVHKPKRHEPER